MLSPIGRILLSSTPTEILQGVVRNIVGLEVPGLHAFRTRASECLKDKPMHIRGELPTVPMKSYREMPSPVTRNGLEYKWCFAAFPKGTHPSLVTDFVARKPNYR
jgi:hypothetical protein